MSGQYKFTYFNMRARGELIRWILSTGGLRWEDNRVAMKDWPATKPTIPGGQLPFLETPEGYRMTQSVAIARYIAKKAGLTPADDYDNYKCDMIVDTVNTDVISAFMKFMPMLPPDQRKQGIDEWNSSSGPRLLGLLNNFVKEGRSGYLVGDRLTWADLSVASFVDNLGQIEEVKDSLKAFPELTAFTERIKQSGKLSDYLKSRPPAEFPL